MCLKIGKQHYCSELPSTVINVFLIQINEMAVRLETSEEALKREKKETVNRQQQGNWQLTQVWQSTTQGYCEIISIH